MKKLFIYIPTYCRPNALKQQLSVLLPQVVALSDNVRIMINDNASDTPVGEFKVHYSSFKNIQFRANSGNIGGNANIALGFIFAEPNEFLWILSDNDIVTDGVISYILDLLRDDVDFYCFNYSVNQPTLVKHTWSSGCQAVMDWRMGLISDGLYNVNSIKESINAAFYYHNSSFPHLAVAFLAMKQKGQTQFMILPREKINNSLFDSQEYPTDYLLAHVCMPLLVPLFTREEARMFVVKWLWAHGISFYINRMSSYHLYLQSRATIAFYGGIKAKLLLFLMWILYIITIPWFLIRPKLVIITRKHLNTTVVDMINKFRRR